MPPPRDSARAAARRASRALPAAARAAAFRRLAPLLRLGGTEAGLVSVVVLCEEVDLPRLPGTLESVRRDAHAYREVLVVPVGDAGAGARAVVAGVDDPRVRVLASAPTWQDAANVGFDAARGRWVRLARACDPHVPDALADLVRSAHGSGSELVTGAVAQRGRPAVWLERASAAAHDVARVAAAPTDLPALAGDLGLGNKLLDTAAWRAAGRRLDSRDGWLLSPTLAGHLASVRRVDVLVRPVLEHLGGHGVRPFGSMPSALRDLEVWAARAEEVERAFAGTPLAAGWSRHVLDIALPGFLLDTERASPQEWERLRALVVRYAAAAVPGPRVEARALLWLAKEGRRDDVAALSAEIDALEGDVPTRVEDDRVLADWEALPADVPAEVRRLTEAETPLVVAVQRRRGDVVDLHLRVDHLDLGDLPAVLAADGAPVATVVDPAATRWAGSRFHRALAATVPAHASELTLDAGPVVRTAPLPPPPARPRSHAPGAAVTVTGLALVGDVLVVERSGPGRLRLVDEHDRELAALDGPGRIPLREQHYGRERWLATGFHRLVTTDGPPRIGPALLDRLPLDEVGQHHRLRASVGPAGGLLLHLGPPLDDAEQGPWAQARLVAAYRAEDRPVDPSVVYFESYAGRSATDSPRAVHDALLARNLGHTTYWGVLDHAQWVPSGATPVLVRSREWYAVLARAGGLVVNTDVEEWFRRRPGQVLLQTFHGYPSKGMGRVQWEAADLPPRRVAVLRARGVDTWSAIVTPTPEMTRHYREQYDYDGPALEHGYPRDDELTAPGAAQRRAATRDLLGLGDRTVVLYAPTWREHLATRARRADRLDFLDLDRAAAALGDGHVLLVRGHRFHERRPTPPGVLDVTDHPEVNDLILAADAAVLDYSSLRFDFALTGNPMVFLVPDLADYGTGTRSFLFPFEDSAPGPMVTDTDEVVDALRDVGALRARWADRIAAFNATFHPYQDGRATERVVDGLLDLLGS